MAAVTGGLVEAQDTAVPEVSSAQLRGLGDGEGKANLRREPPDVGNSHWSLTRLVWIRRAQEYFGRNLRFKLVQATEGGHAGQLVLRITDSPFRATKGAYDAMGGEPRYQPDAVPWSGSTPISEVPLWGWNSKMRCPSFDLPAGAPSLGGTCPGATAGQTPVPPNRRMGQLQPTAGGLALRAPEPGTGQPVAYKPGYPICAACYATVGNFQYASNQFAELLRFWWVRQMLAEGHADELAAQLTLAIRLTPFPSVPYDRTGRFIGEAGGGILPIRVHSSGDFFEPAYARVWLDVADRLWRLKLHRVSMWAPTRTWAAPGWERFWQTELPKLQSYRESGIPNLIVRPSAYHFDDRAPGPLAEGNAMGTTSLLGATDSGIGREVSGNADTFRAQGEMQQFYDWRCPAYSVKEGGHSCSEATNPDGRAHCRVCWVRPDLRVNYPAH